MIDRLNAALEDRYSLERELGEPERHIVIHNWFGELRRIFERSR